MNYTSYRLFLSRCIGVLLVFLLFGLSYDTTYAQDFSLSVTPTSTAISLTTQNTEKKQSYILTNNSTKSKKIFIQLFPIEKVDKFTNRPLYQPISTLTEAQQSFYQSAISFEHETRKISEITLAPKQTETVHMTITYKENLSDDDYYFTIGFTDNDPYPEADKEENEITADTQIRTIVGSHVFVSLGNRESDLIIREFTSDNLISSSLPTVSYKLENPTNKYIKTYSKISFYNIFSMKIAEHVLEDSVILAGHTKDIRITHDDVSALVPIHNLASLGLSKAVLEVYDVENKTSYKREFRFIVFPFSAGIALIVVLIIGLTISKRVREKMN